LRYTSLFCPSPHTFSLTVQRLDYVDVLPCLSSVDSTLGNWYSPSGLFTVRPGLGLRWLNCS